MSATEKAATADEKTPVAVQKAPPEAENKAQEPLMYVGPTIPGIAIQNTVYEPVPELSLIHILTAVSVKERIAACLSVFIKKQLPPVGMGRSGSNSGNAGQKEYDGKTLTPGMIKELNAGDEVQVVNPTGQATDAASFTKLHQRMIGAGQGLSYEATSRDMRCV